MVRDQGKTDCYINAKLSGSLLWIVNVMGPSVPVIIIIIIITTAL